ncbi:Protein accelerated cell death 6 [Vitis vinifera]|uniref:Protein accelerated cell death 6 n=1 Tax=Vitis vinifera TaxID=29760 RepID=A0A438JK78_VITVI|nr:Protein accelerated cell death 6 [Vitis vinifera]
MGRLDIQIEIERQSRWIPTNGRIQRLQTIALSNSDASIPNVKEWRQPRADRPHNHMDLQLYRAATEADVDGFLNNTLLHVAAASGNLEIVALIVYRYPWLATKTNSNGDTALHLAAKAGDELTLSVIVQLLTSDVHSQSSGYSRVWVKEVEDDDLPFRKRNKQGNTALHEALINGHQWVALNLFGSDPQVVFYLNREGKSPLYLAAEAGYDSCVLAMLKSSNHFNYILKMPGVLDIMLKKDPSMIYSRDEEGRTPLHYAASIGHLKGVHYLLGKYALGAVERDNSGFFPIHMASIKGHVDVIRELLRHCPDPRELLSDNGQNILHVAAINGKYEVVSCILKTPELGKLINEKDKVGNTPLHLATMHWHPMIVSALTGDERVDLKLLNNEGLTAFDAAEYYMETLAPYQRLTWTALRVAGAPRATCPKPLKAIGQSSVQVEPPKMDIYRDRVNTLLLVATLVATVSFAAGFTVPGGYNNSEPDQGMATMLRHKKLVLTALKSGIATIGSFSCNNVFSIHGWCLSCREQPQLAFQYCPNHGLPFPHHSRDTLLSTLLPNLIKKLHLAPHLFHFLPPDDAGDRKLQY